MSWNHNGNYGSNYTETNFITKQKNINPSTSAAYGRSPSVPLFTSNNHNIGQFKKKPPTRSLSEKMLQNLTNVAEKIIHPKIKSTDYIARYSSMAVAVRDSDLATLGDDEDTESAPIDGETVSSAKRKFRLEVVTSPMGLFLNLLVTFLYQANQYVVAPTSGKYASQLGMSESMSGAIIGATPTAVIISALVFSAWSNYSFKKPLITCLSMSVIGNICYAIALQFHSTTLIFVGRLLTGLGGPRGVTRRYIADHVSMQDRTAASSHFITAGAMGLTCGPLIAFLTSTSLTNFTISIHGRTLLIFSDVTAPGWIMAVLYFISLILCIIYFEEPISKLHSGINGWNNNRNMSSVNLPTTPTNNNTATTNNNNNNNNNNHITSSAYIPTPNRRKIRININNNNNSIFNIKYLCQCILLFISDTIHTIIIICYYLYLWITCSRSRYQPIHHSSELGQNNHNNNMDDDHYNEYNMDTHGSVYEVVVAAEMGDWQSDVKPTTIVTNTNIVENYAGAATIDGSYDNAITSLTDSASHTVSSVPSSVLQTPTPTIKSSLKQNIKSNIQNQSILSSYGATDTTYTLLNPTTTTSATTNTTATTTATTATTSATATSTATATSASNNANTTEAHTIADEDINIQKSIQLQQDSISNHRKPPKTKSQSHTNNNNNISSNSNTNNNHRQSTNPNSLANTTSPLSSASTVQVVKPKFDTSLGIYYSPARDKLTDINSTTNTTLSVMSPPPQFPQLGPISINESGTVNTVTLTSAPTTTTVTTTATATGITNKQSNYMSVLSTRPTYSASIIPVDVSTTSLRGGDSEPSTSPLNTRDLYGRYTGSHGDIIGLQVSSSSSPTSTQIHSGVGRSEAARELGQGLGLGVNTSTGSSGISISIQDKNTSLHSDNMRMMPDMTLQMKIISPSNSTSNLISPIQSSDSYHATGHNLISVAVPNVSISSTSVPTTTTATTTTTPTITTTDLPMNTTTDMDNRPRGISTVSSASTEYATLNTIGIHTQSHPPHISNAIINDSAMTANNTNATTNTNTNTVAHQDPKQSQNNNNRISNTSKSHNNNRIQQEPLTLRQLIHTPYLHSDDHSRRLNQSWSRVSLMSTNSLYSLHTPNNHNQNTHASEYTCIWHLISVEVAVILFIYFLNKVGQELVVSSVPTLCSGLFGWTAQMEGLFMAILGALVIPGSLMVGRLADGVSDRELVQNLSYLSLVSVIIVLQTTWFRYTLGQYIVGSVVLFSLLNTLEGVIMAMMSKLISPQLAKGTFNSGLLSTEAGTIGRVVGDMTITILSTYLGSTTSPTASGSGIDMSMNKTNSIINLVNCLYAPIGIGIVVSIILIHYFSTRLDSIDIPR